MTKNMLPNIFNALDEQVMKYFTKIALNFEKRGHSKYDLCNILSFTSLFTIEALYSRYTGHDPKYSIIRATGCSLGIGIGRHMVDNNERKKYDTIMKTEMVLSLEDQVNFEWREKYRLPLLVSGATFIGKGILEVIGGKIIGDSQQITYGVLDIIGGYGLSAFVSSLYIKDTNPKFLDKQTKIEKLLNLIGDHISRQIGSYLPAPELSPIHIK